jgi:NADPH-dependent 2,4-dienoyl-CoA reductase/sulfur reductase-like enzyme
VLQLGAGFIGCIIMEALAARGVQLTVVEMGDRMVPRMMTPKAGNMIRKWVERKGIRVVTGAGVQRIDAGGGKPGLVGQIVQAVTGGRKEDGALTVALSTGEVMAADLVIVAAGVAPNVGFLDGTPVQVAKGVLVDPQMRTSVPDIYAAGDVAEAPDLFTGAHLVSAIQPNAADQARIAALNMIGRETKLPGVLAINVLDTLGLISTSFGQWWGEKSDAGGSGVELVDEALHKYLSLQFKDDVLIGATAIGTTQHVGVLRGLIQNRTRLGAWKDELLKSPTRFVEAYVACQQPVALAR